MGVIHDGNGKAFDENNPMHVKPKIVEVQPTGIEYRAQKTIQTHNAVSVAASSLSDGAWTDCNGFDKLAGTFLNDASTSSEIAFRWSNDGVNLHGYESLGSSTSQRKQFETPIKARYVSLRVANGDTVAHTMSAWAYLKS